MTDLVSGGCCQAARVTCLLSMRTSVQRALVLVLVLLSVARGCKFPRYLQKSSIWTTHYRDGSVFRIYFKGNHIDASECEPDNTCIEYTRKCLSKISDEKFEVEHIDKVDGPSRYLCMQFLHRTDSIIQIKESQKLTFRNPNACNDSKLTLDNWPLVNSETFVEEHIRCPFSGGYNIRLQTSDSQPICPKVLIPPRFESECEVGDGVTLNFRVPECKVKALDMELEQQLYCAASWTHGPHTFIILRPQEVQFKAWCLRLTGTQPLDKIEYGHLFMDLVCDPGDGNGQIRETTNYLYLEFEQHIVNTICVDQTLFCDEKRLCGYDAGLDCLKSCNLCPPEITPCTFPETFRGNWTETYGGNRQSVNISFYSLRIPDSGSFHCYENEGHDFANSTMLFQVFENGCFPRFACLDIEKVSPSTLSYRLGNRVRWPVRNWDRLKSQVCDEKRFRPNAQDKVRLGRNIDEKPMTMLIDTQHHYPVHCQLNDWSGYRERQLFAREDNNCDTCLVYEIEETHRHSDRIIQVLLNCSSSSRHLQCQNFKCIAALPQSENVHAVVTRSLHKYSEYLCWVFEYGHLRSNEHGKVYVLDASDCNSVAIAAVLRGDLRPKHEYVMPQSAPKPCPYIGQLQSSFPQCEHTTTYSVQEVTPITTGNPTRWVEPSYTVPVGMAPSSEPSSGQAGLHRHAVTTCLFLLSFLITVLALSDS